MPDISYRIENEVIAKNRDVIENFIQRFKWKGDFSEFHLLLKNNSSKLLQLLTQIKLKMKLTEAEELVFKSQTRKKQ